MHQLTNLNGITIKDLKEYVKDLPEQDKNGDLYEVWVEKGGYSNIAKAIYPLNKGDLLICI